MKKILFSLLLLIGLTWFFVKWEDFPYDVSKEWNVVKSFDNESLDIWNVITQDAVQPDTSILQRLLSIFQLKWSNWYDTNWELKAFAYVKMIINFMLALVSLIALILTIYGFYLMFFSWQDEWLKKARKILTWVAIAMAIMWLSRFIISFLFYVYNINTQ